jgi:N-acyl homoserine lactone hydrolase
VPPPAIAPVLVAELLVESERWPVYVHAIDHPHARVLVDTGMTELHPEVADLDPRLVPLSEQSFDLAGIDLVVNTHLHFDHCGGNHLFPGRPIYVQERELEDARSQDGYTIRDWVEAPGVRYEPVDGEFELLPGLRLLPAPGHTRGLQVSSSRREGGRSSWAATLPFASTSSTSRAPRANSGCARSTPSSSGSRTSTSPGASAPRRKLELAVDLLEPAAPLRWQSVVRVLADAPRRLLIQKPRYPTDLAL